MPFDILWGNVLFTLISFAILLVLLGKYAWGPLMKVMEERQQHIENEIKTAEKERADAEKYLQEQKEAIEQARKEAADIIERARGLGEQQAVNIVKTAKEEADKLRNQALSEIERERDLAVNKIREQVGALSVLLASKIIEKELNEKDQEKLIQDYLQEINGRLEEAGNRS